MIFAFKSSKICNKLAKLHANGSCVVVSGRKIIYALRDASDNSMQSVEARKGDLHKGLTKIALCPLQSMTLLKFASIQNSDRFSCYLQCRVGRARVTSRSDWRLRRQSRSMCKHDAMKITSRKGFSCNIALAVAHCSVREAKTRVFEVEPKIAIHSRNALFVFFLLACILFGCRC